MQTKQKYDPNLKGAMEEIRSILEKRDIGGHVLLASPTHAQFGMFYDAPKWSVISFEKAMEGQVGIRIRARHSTPGDDERLAATAHMLCMFQDMLLNGADSIEITLAKLREHIAVLHLNRRGVAPDPVPE